LTYIINFKLVSLNSALERTFKLFENEKKDKDIPVTGRGT
jgi:hypothetical protein